ncbi:MAG: LysR family transcriptional regulator ArgP [Paludibacterium sp.]|uniref:LysR family transcriptional regulator ArgP n=1 Tax=Paludibacterium sp. TaxID=1917523 RepID=UPI002600F3F8|nr:LysR family transcriptional regulator ArgP [Paludibacterium sp.]MBV8047113.1 LysR family transcriptional regulator ArgP [Paludibacterium sp.]MBV8649268.1 LysR family transcriptional regulator ArgP [Paludibacterium sp.]
MKIDSGQLAAFFAVLREGSFEAASRRLNVTPSAVSQRVKLLEERLGQILINRKTPSVPTPAGEPLARLAMQINLLEEEALREMGGDPLESDSPVWLPIAVNGDSLDNWFFEALDALPAEARMVFDIRMEDQDYSATLLREGTVMAAVTTDATPVQGCEVERLGVMRYLAVASPAFIERYFAAGVTDDGLHAAPMLVFNQKDSLQQRFVDSVTQRPLSPLQHTIPSTACFVEMVLRGLGWGMMPEIAARAALAQGRLKEILPGHWLDIPLYWQHWRIRSQALMVLTSAVRRTAALHLRTS